MTCPRTMLCPRAILGVVLFSSTAIPAQVYHASPLGFLTTEGAKSSSSFGAYPVARHMLFDGELRGIAGLVKEVTFRVDYHVHATQLEVGRSWTGVTLDISHCDLANLSQTFSTNPTSTPARVFSAPVNWRQLSGLPLLKPAPWGTLHGFLRFPFSQPWSSAGQRDICLDFDFNGGVLANNGAWPETTAREYHLDGFQTPPTQLSNSGVSYGPFLTNGGCVDSLAGHGLGGFTQVSATTHTLVSTWNPGKFVLAVTSLATANSKPAVHAFSLGGSSQGVVFPGVTCNRLYLDLSKPTVLLTKVAAPPVGRIDYLLGPFTYTPAVGNLPIWFQVAWDDSGGAGVKLTSATRVVVPKMPVSFLRSCLYQPVSLSKNSTGIGPSGATGVNPILRYTM